MVVGWYIVTSEKTVFCEIAMVMIMIWKENGVSFSF